MRRSIIRVILATCLLVGLTENYLTIRPSSAQSCSITTSSAKVGNGTLSYNQVGKGESILLLHGLFAEKEQWNGIMCQLSEAGYQAIAPDLPGYGNSKGFSVKDYALENQARLLNKFMNGLGIQSFDVAGSSMGGAIAHLYIQYYSKQVRSLAFIGSPLGVIDWGKGVRDAILKGINPFIPITKKQFDLEISLLFVSPPTIPESVKAEKVRDYITDNRRYQQTWDIVNLYDDVLCQKSPIQRPTLAIWGKEDKIYDITGAARLQQCISGSQIIRLPKAGHLLLIENADEAASRYLGFLQTVRSKQSTSYSHLDERVIAPVTHIKTFSYRIYP